MFLHSSVHNLCQTHKYKEDERDEQLLKEPVYLWAVQHQDKAKEYRIRYTLNIV